MLKGHVFKQQIFGNQIFAVFINTFLNGKNGISNDYKNKLAVSYSGSTVTVQSGVVCIQGRFLEEDTSTSISTGTDTAYCKLVIEINLDKQASESELAQAYYKVVKSESGYPELTQSEIVKNNAGIYQYEIARFRTTSSGIVDFQDMRTFLDFESIYSAIEKEYKVVLKQLQDELEAVQNGSAYKLKSDLAILEGNLTIESQLAQSFNMDYPTGFDMSNCVAIACALATTNGKGYNYIGDYQDSSDGLNNSFKRRLNLNSTNIVLKVTNPNTTSLTVQYKIVLMKF